MKFKPANWTHHHTHRLYHLSIGVCFSFIALVVLYGTITIWLKVNAQSLSETVTVMAVVPAIESGPISGGGPTPVPPPQEKPPVDNQTQTISIFPEPRGQIPQKEFTEGGKKVLLYTFPTQRPAFSGQTSIPRALIFITVNNKPVIYSTTRANAEGYWSWTSPIALSNGIYNISARAEDPANPSISAETSLGFAVEVKAEEPGPAGHGAPPGPTGKGTGTGSGSGPAVFQSGFLNIFLKIPSHYKIVHPGQKVIAEILLMNNDPKHLFGPQDIVYTIENSRHQVIVEATDTMNLDKSLSFSKSFITNPVAAPGLYTIIAQAQKGNSLAIASDTFRIRIEPPPAPRAPMFPWWEIIISTLLILFAVIAAFAYHHVALAGDRIREHDKISSDSKTPPL